MRIFPPDQSSTGLFAFGLSVAAVAALLLADFAGLLNRLLLLLICAACTLLGFIFGAYAQQERTGRTEAATSALVTCTVLLVYYAITRIF